MKLAMWFFMLVCNLLIPAAMILLGRRFEKNPPREINAAFGYRTNRSMKNQDTWDFAQRKTGQVWMGTGAVLALLAVIWQSNNLIYPTIEAMCLWSIPITVVEAAVMTATCFPVERALKQNFDENGVRRQN